VGLAGANTLNIRSLQPLGWSQFFLQQLDLEHLDLDSVDSEHNTFFLFRISAIHRTVIKGLGESWLAGETELLCPEKFHPVSEAFAVGDWVVAEKTNEHFRIIKVLEAKSQLERLSNQRKQLIASNIDWLFIVTSANDEFNLKRLERYLAMAYESQIEPVVILNKVDLCDNSEEYIDQVKTLNVNEVVSISTLQPDSLQQLSHFLTPASTIAIVGSSGVGKSSLVNALFQLKHNESKPLKTGEIRHDDDKGKHTTTSRQLLINSEGVMLIDTPGIRELQLLGAVDGIQQTFNDIIELAKHCKFANCHHKNEPGCQVQRALIEGDLTHSHLDNYEKLLREDAFHARSAQGAYAHKQHMRKFQKEIKATLSAKAKYNK
jgi:ribosome biogenesis GTPase